MIESLTSEQEAAMPRFVEKWIKKGTCTSQLPEEDIKSIVGKFVHSVLDKPKDIPIHVFNSPYQAWVYINKKYDIEEDNLLPFVTPYVFGSFDAGYYAWIDFMEYIGVKDFPSLANDYEELVNVGLVFVFDDYIVATQKPSVLKMENGELHCENGPALAYDDDHKSDVYCLNGVTMEKEHVMTPAEKLDPRDIMKIENVEVRRELVRKVGIERLLEALESKVLDTMDDYELLSVNLSEDLKDARYLKMTNPSIQVFHVEAVAPECNTVQHAINWRKFGNIDDHWTPEVLT